MTQRKQLIPQTSHSNDPSLFSHINDFSYTRPMPDYTNDWRKSTDASVLWHELFICEVLHIHINNSCQKKQKRLQTTGGNPLMHQSFLFPLAWVVYTYVKDFTYKQLMPEESSYFLWHEFFICEVLHRCISHLTCKQLMPEETTDSTDLTYKWLIVACTPLIWGGYD